MGTRRKDTPASQVQGMVREGFQEEVTSKLNPDILARARSRGGKGSAGRGDSSTQGTETVLNLVYLTSWGTKHGGACFCGLGTVLCFTNTYSQNPRSCP